MSKGLSSFPEERRAAIATRRLNNGVRSDSRGNGFWGAKDYFVKKGMRLPGKLGVMQDIADAMKNMEVDGENITRSFSAGGGKLRSKPPRDKAPASADRGRKGNHRRKNRGDTLASVWPVGGPFGRKPVPRAGSRTGSQRGARQHATR